ncbi:hypothetical protein PR048_010075 [Dryococelus australis]|uniref:Uncharacterized protein n=1 Tax=Dryococelus australis TaxID=614101 RepID=A0ABQ9I1P2_9NEOP|nr:hypothetical protein PR048_010075 [Dryococelus australis]
MYRGAAVAEQLACSPPTKAIRLQSPAGSPDFRMWESCRTMLLVGGSSRGFTVSPAHSFRRCSILTSIALVGPEGIAVKSRPKFFSYMCRMVRSRTWMAQKIDVSLDGAETRVDKESDQDVNVSDGWAGVVLVSYEDAGVKRVAAESPRMREQQVRAAAGVRRQYPPCLGPRHNGTPARQLDSRSTGCAYGGNTSNVIAALVKLDYTSQLPLQCCDSIILNQDKRMPLLIE